MQKGPYNWVESELRVQLLELQAKSSPIILRRQGQLLRRRGRRRRWARRLIFHFYPRDVYPGARVEEECPSATSSTLALSTPALGQKRKRNAPAPQLVGPVRITPQFESSRTQCKSPPWLPLAEVFPWRCLGSLTLSFRKWDNFAWTSKKQFTLTKSKITI